MTDESVLIGASDIILMYGNSGSSMFSFTIYPIELTMNFLFDSFETFVMFAIGGYSLNEITRVEKRSLPTLIFSISGYDDWMRCMISSFLMKSRFLPLYILRSSMILLLRLSVVICSVETLMSVMLKTLENPIK